MTEELIRQALARGYCTKENELKVFDPVLIDAMAREILLLHISCHVCGGRCSVYPLAVCYEHCPDHDFEYDKSRRGTFCKICDYQRDPQDDY